MRLHAGPSRVNPCPALPPHPLIHHQGQAALELHSGPGRDGFDFGDIQMEAIVQRDDFASHAWGDKSGFAF